jgi:hypothetical protein
MPIVIETDRLLLRELRADDVPGMFAMDSDPEVHRYLGNHPLVDLAQSREHIAFIQQQYRENGVGRWAVLERQTGDFVGWSGLKVIPNPLQPQTTVHELATVFSSGIGDGGTPRKRPARCCATVSRCFAWRRFTAWPMGRTTPPITCLAS